MTLQLDFTNYELSANRIARAIYESLAIEGGRQSYPLRDNHAVVHPGAGRGTLSAARLSKESWRMKHLANALMRRPLNLKNKYTFSPYFIVPRYTIPSKLIITTKDSDSPPVEIRSYDGDEIGRKLRIRRIEIELSDAGQEYVDAGGVKVGLPVDTTQPFGYTDPWPIRLTLSPLERVVEFITSKNPKHQYLTTRVAGYYKEFRNNALYGPKKAILALYNRLAKEAQKTLKKYYSATKIWIMVRKGAVLRTEDNTPVQLQSAPDGSRIDIPADLSIEGARASLDLYYAKSRDIIKAPTNLKDLIPLEFASLNAATREGAIIKEILTQFFAQHMPNIHKEEVDVMIRKAVDWLKWGYLSPGTKIIANVENERNYGHILRHAGTAISIPMLQKVTDRTASWVRGTLAEAGIDRVIRDIDYELRDNLIALLIYALTTTYYAATNLWDYFVRAIEAEDPITGHKQWKYSVGIDSSQLVPDPTFLVNPYYTESVRMICEDTDSGEEVVLTFPYEELCKLSMHDLRIDTTAFYVALESEVSGYVNLPARCVEWHVDSDLVSTYHRADGKGSDDKYTLLRIDKYTKKNVYGTLIDHGVEPKLIREREILST